MKNRLVTNIITLLIVYSLSIPAALWSQEKEVEGEKEEESLEEIFQDTKVMFVGKDLYTVSIASRREEPLRRAPAAVTVISGEELKRFRTLAEVLASVPGFFADRNEIKNRVFLRGMPDSFLVMMDGVPFSNDTSTKDYPREMELSLDYLEKIEIVRGPGSALWGADAFSGIVNLVTKKGKDVQGTILSSEVGTFNTQRYKLLSGYKKGDVDLLLSANYTASDDFEHNPTQDPLSPAVHDRKRDYFNEFYGKLRYKEMLEISGRYSDYKNFFSTPRFHYNGEEYTPFSFLQVTFNKEIGSSSNLLHNVYMERIKNQEEFELFTLQNKNWQYGGEGKYDFNFLKNHFMTIGASIRINDGSSTKTRLKFLGNPIDTTIRSFDTRLYSFYFQDKYKITDDLELTAGVRYDNHSEYKRTISPRAGISWSFLNNFTLKLLYGKAFRTPALFLLVDERNLDPERIESFEAELGYQYKETLSLNLNFFYNRLKDIIEEVSYGRIRNRKRDRVKGIELSASYQPISVLSLYANFSYLLQNRREFEVPSDLIGVEYREVEAEEQSIDSSFLAPRSVCNWGINYNFLKYATLNLHFSYYAKRKLPENAFYIREGSVSPYLMVDCNLFVKHLLDDKLEMSLKIRNAFGTNYHSRGDYSVIDGSGRGVFFSLEYKF